MPSARRVRLCCGKDRGMSRPIRCAHAGLGRWCSLVVVILVTVGCGDGQRGGLSHSRREPAIAQAAGDSSPARPQQPAPHDGGDGAISGVVRDRTGEPVRLARVVLAGRTRRQILTDQRGGFLFDRLAPGAYTLSAQKLGYVAAEFGQERPWEPGERITIDSTTRAVEATLQLQPGGAVVGRVEDERGEPLADATVQVLRPESAAGTVKFAPVETPNAVRSDEAGRFHIAGLAPGPYIVSAAVAGAFRDADRPSRLLTYATRYAPSAVTPAAARRIDVVVGREVDATVVLRPTTLLRIAGEVVDESGIRVGGRAGVVRLTAAGAASPAEVSSLRPDGGFEIRTAAPAGDYVVAVSVNEPGAIGVEGHPRLARAPLRLADADVTGLRLTARLGADIAGQVKVDAAPHAPLPLPMRVYARPFVHDGSMIGSIAVSVDPSGRFTLRNVFDPSWIAVDLDERRGWFVKAVYVGSRDVTDSGLNPRPGEVIEDVSVLLTTRMSTVSGVVRMAVDRRATDCVVTVFAEDEKKWRDPRGRFVRAVRLSREGRFTIGGLPRGVYFAVAQMGIGMASASAPARLRDVKGRATRVQLDEGVTTEMELAVMPEP